LKTLRSILAFFLLNVSLFIITGSGNTASAQDFLGYSGSNYAGVSGIDLNPACIADNRYKFDMTLVGANFTFANNYIGLSKEAMKNKSVAFADTAFRDKYLIERINKANKAVFLSLQLVMPSFMVTLSPKHAFAITTRMRTIFNIDGLEPELASLMYHQLNDPMNWKQKFSNENFSVQEMTWIEYGASYARVIKEDGGHFVKAGGRLKFLQGMYAAYLYVDNLEYNFANDTVLSIFNTDVNYGHSNSFTLDQDMGKFVFGSKPSFGMDLGGVYEWRPDHAKFKSDMDGESGVSMRNKEKYKLRAGFSILDLGYIGFKKSTVGNFSANVTNWPIDTLVSDSSLNPISNFDSIIASTFTLTEGVGNFRMNLPTALSLQVDYNIYKDFYVNFTSFYAFRFKNNKDKTHDLTTFSITPRWDWKWFGVFVPISYNSFRNTSIGLAARLGPLIVGTNNLSSALGLTNVFGANAYFLLKIPIFYGKIKDRDKDHISDRKDKCKEVPGTWEFLGCPDRDLDHVPDNKDDCPDTPGVPEFNGCPDRDGDKLIDKKDSCPDVAGLLEFNGCPDRDSDKIIDKRDSCPDEAGLAEYYGCPDTDRDKVIDKLDACPTDSGAIASNGCPDTDGDGILNKDDRCPDKAGPKENNGCPLATLHLLDSAGNIIMSAEIKDGKYVFPEQPPMNEKSLLKLESYDVLVANEATVVTGKQIRIARKGMDGYFHFEYLSSEKQKPGKVEAVDVQIQLKVEEAKKIQKAMETLEFDTGKDIIRTSSMDALDLVAELLMQNHAWRLKLSGHTDNVASAKFNTNLSKKRVESIKKYLIKKGVEADRFVLKWYGPTQPIAPNDTEEGRQKNRRVEFLIIE